MNMTPMEAAGMDLANAVNKHMNALEKGLSVRDAAELVFKAIAVFEAGAKHLPATQGFEQQLRASVALERAADVVPFRAKPSLRVVE